MVIACKGIDILKRVLCLLLCVVLLFCFFMVPRAGAVALEATTIAYGGLLVGTILVGAGVVFSSHGDMVKVGNAMYKTLVNGSSAIGKTISSISAWAVEHGTSLAKGALRVGKDMYKAIVDAFNASYSNGKVSLGADVVTLPTDPTEEEIKSFCNLFANKDVKRRMSAYIIFIIRFLALSIAWLLIMLMVVALLIFMSVLLILVAILLRMLISRLSAIDLL